jgi:hypothetical protein
MMQNDSCVSVVGLYPSIGMAGKIVHVHAAGRRQPSVYSVCEEMYH